MMGYPSNWGQWTSKILVSTMEEALKFPKSQQSLDFYKPGINIFYLMSACQTSTAYWLDYS